MPVKMVFLQVQHNRRFKGVRRESRRFHLKRAHLHNSPFGRTFKSNLAHGLSEIAACNSASAGSFERVCDCLDNAGFAFGTSNREKLHPLAAALFDAKLQLADDIDSALTALRHPWMGGRDSRRCHGKRERPVRQCAVAGHNSCGEAELRRKGLCGPAAHTAAHYENFSHSPQTIVVVLPMMPRMFFTL